MLQPAHCWPDYLWLVGLPRLAEAANAVMAGGMGFQAACHAVVAAVLGALIGCRAPSWHAATGAAPDIDAFFSRILLRRP